jgi:hypothetical protein
VNRDASSIAILEPRKNVGYGREDVPCARDGQIRDLVLELADNASFEQVSGLVPRDADRVLTAFAERAASIAVRGKDERELRAGLLAAALALSLSDDERDVLPAVALLYRAATMIGRDPERAFAAVNDLTDGRAPACRFHPAYIGRPGDRGDGLSRGCRQEWGSVRLHLVKRLRSIRT